MAYGALRVPGTVLVLVNQNQPDSRTFFAQTNPTNATPYKTPNDHCAHNQLITIHNGQTHRDNQPEPLDTESVFS